jgi:hypothetical protein
LAEHGDIYVGIGKLSGECTIQIDPSVAPVIHSPRKVPLAVHKKLSQELTLMKSEGMIAKVTEPTPRVHSLVVVETSSKYRVCLDPRNLNKAKPGPHYHMSTLEDALPELTDAKVLTKLDLRYGH